LEEDDPFFKLPRFDEVAQVLTQESKDISGEKQILVGLINDWL